jgi:nitrate/nitrite transporter NarK
MHDVVHSNPIDILYRGFCPCSKDRDVFKNYRTVMPKRFQTPSKRFSRFLLVFLLCSIASGPLNSWPTIEPLLGELHVLGSTFNHSSVQLNEVQTLGFSFGSLLSIPLGLAYDVFGPGLTAAGGAFTASVGTLSMALAISNTRYNWILFWAYPLATIGGSMNSMAILGWQWLMPERQNLVNSLYGASLAISDTFAIVGVLLINRNILTLQTFFLLIGMVSLFVCIVCYLVTPSKFENNIHYMIVLNENTKYEREKSNFNSIDRVSPKSRRKKHLQEINYTTGSLGQETHQHNNDDEKNEENAEDIAQIKSQADELRKDSTCSTNYKQMWNGIKGSWKVIMKFPVPMCLAQCFICMIYWGSFYPMASMYNYYILIFGIDDAVTLVDAFSVIYGITGSVFTVVAGWLCDRWGLVRFLRYTVILLIVTATLQLIPNYEIQLLWITLWTMNFNLFMIIYIRLTMHYAPMEIFGAFQGMLGTFMVLPQLICSGMLRAYFTKAYSNSPMQFYYPYIILNGLTIIFGILLCVYWLKYPPPKVGAVIWGKDGGIYESMEEMEADSSSKPLIDRRSEQNYTNAAVHYDSDEIRGSFDNQDFNDALKGEGTGNNYKMKPNYESFF